MTEGITLATLSDDDLAYAPPFTTTRDPVLAAAKVLEGKR